jgi:chromosome segregation ATPase
MEDPRILELLVEMSMKLDKLDKKVDTLDKKVDTLDKKVDSLATDLADVQKEQRRLSNVVWELSQMMEKVIWEPMQQQAKDLAEITVRVAQLESH